MRWFAWLLAALVIGAATARAEILVGVAGPLTGQYAALGDQMRKGVEAAVSAVNATGGINGEPLAVTAADDACDTRRAVAIARQFVSQDVRLVVGHYCSGASAAAALVYREAGIIMVMPSASQPALTEARNWNVFRITGRDDASFAMAASRILSQPGSPKTAVVNSSAAPSQALVKPALALLPGALQLVVKLGSFDSTETARQIMDNGIGQVIVALPGAEASSLASSLLYAGFQGTIYGGEQFLTEEFAAGASAVQFQMLAAFPQDPMASPSAIRVIGQFTAGNFAPDGATLPAYAAVETFAAAAKARSVNDGAAMAAWLRAGNAVDTVLGRTAFDAKGDLAPQPFTWYRWQGTAKRFVPE